MGIKRETKLTYTEIRAFRPECRECGKSTTHLYHVPGLEREGVAVCGVCVIFALEEWQIFQDVDKIEAANMGEKKWQTSPAG